MKTELLGGKIIFFAGEKETHGVGREIFVYILVRVGWKC
jgi:hypothetical protein